MGAVAVGALLVAVLLAIVAAMVWQEARRRPSGEPVVYVIEEASRFVHHRLPPAVAGRLGVDDARRILEWSLFHSQVLAVRRVGPPPVLGSGDTIDYVVERSRAAGYDYDPMDIGAVIAAEADYLFSIGAIGERAEEEAT